MSAWLDASADGIVMLGLVFTGLLAMVLLGAVVEWFAAHSMRRRNRKRRSLARYCDSIRHYDIH